MLIWTENGWKSFSTISASTPPVQLIAVHLDWISHRNESINRYNALIHFAQTYFKRMLDCKFVEKLEIPEWCKLR